MSDNAESGIAATQARSAQNKALGQHHKSTLGYLNERIFTYVFMIALLGLVAIWSLAKSPYIIYGSLIAVVFIAMLAGFLEFKRRQRLRELREQQAKEWTSHR